MTCEEFEKSVRKALRSLPKRFKDKLQNVDFVIEESSRRKHLLGLYEGVPLNERTQGYGMVLPDKITLFKRNIEAESEASGTSLVDEIRHTVEHEIAHHFGMTDEELENRKIY